MRRGGEDQFQVEVLLVEDDPGDMLLIQECFRRSGYPARISQVGNGEACLALLNKAGPYAQAPTPDMILLDLRIPVMDGREVMAALVADRRFQRLPVVVLTAVSEEADIRAMYALRCNTYVVKPKNFEELQHIVSLVCEYWFRIATLPDVTV